MGPIMNSLFPQAYTDLFAETHANVCSSTGATVQSFSGGLSGHGFLKNVLEHYIKNQAWGPNGPQSYEDLCHESQQWNMSAGQDHKGKINLRWINDTAPLRPIPAKPTVASTLILETAFPTLALTSVKEGKKLVDKQLGWIDASSLLKFADAGPDEMGTKIGMVAPKARATVTSFTYKLMKHDSETYLCRRQLVNVIDANDKLIKVL
ncbi:hypothetical protein B0A53_02124 [Rhodotorula sp. CCFEE 5036]|nr:hypothetical protein B0A53_02124 [Rhodotorula sp. CCFEE 5036]